MKNHAFLLPVHKQPNLVARIINVLQADNHYFFVHVDKKVTNYNDFVEACKDMKNVMFVRRIPVYWATISQVNATLMMLEEVERHPVHFHYVHQISGNDYPLRSNEQFDSFFENTEDSFMCYNYEKDMDYWKPIYDRHVNWYYPNGDDNWWEKAVIKFGNSRFRRFFTRKPIPELAGSWDWWSWSEAVVTYIMHDLRNVNRKGGGMLKRFNHTCAPGEHFFATLLYKHLDELHIHKHFPLRYVSWKPYRKIEQKHRPYDLTEQDYERVINSAAFFCRKVDEVTSAKFLDMVDAQRGNRYDITEHDYFF